MNSIANEVKGRETWHARIPGRMRLTDGDALLLVNAQRDFLSDGSTPVSGSASAIQAMDACLDAFAARRLPVYASRDWHPPDHCSFVTRGGPWPPHCVAGTLGAELLPQLRWPAHLSVVSKGTHPDEDPPSAFCANAFNVRLVADGVDRLFIAGLSSDNAVFYEACDARRWGFSVVLVRDAIAANDVRPGARGRLLKALSGVGSRIIDSAGLSVARRVDGARGGARPCPSADKVASAPFASAS